MIFNSWSNLNCQKRKQLIQTLSSHNPIHCLCRSILSIANHTTTNFPPALSNGWRLPLIFTPISHQHFQIHHCVHGHSINIRMKHALANDMLFYSNSASTFRNLAQVSTTPACIPHDPALKNGDFSYLVFSKGRLGVTQVFLLT